MNQSPFTNHSQLTNQSKLTSQPQLTSQPHLTSQPQLTKQPQCTNPDFFGVPEGYVRYQDLEHGSVGCPTQSAPLHQIADAVGQNAPEAAATDGTLVKLEQQDEQTESGGVTEGGMLDGKEASSEATAFTLPSGMNNGGDVEMGGPSEFVP